MNSDRAEQMVLGCLMQTPARIELIDGKLRPSHFAHKRHRTILNRIIHLNRAGKPVDAVSIFDSLESDGKAEDVGGLAYIGNLEGNALPAQFDAYVDQIIDLARKRRLHELLGDAVSKIETNGDVTEILKSITEVASDASNGWPEPADLKKLSQSEPEKPRTIIDDWLPAGYATMFAGHGGVGKSGVALHLACCIALGFPWCDLQVEQRRVLYLSCEDRESALHWRLSRISQYLGISLDSLAGQLGIVDLVGHDSTLWSVDPRNPLTINYEYLRAMMAGYEVLIVDGISDVFAGNENSRSDVKRFINSLVALCPHDTGAVLLIGHVAKPTASGASSEGYSGSTSWHNSVRARWYLYPETERTDDGNERTGNLVLDLQKSNMGRTAAQLKFKWDDDKHLFVGEHVDAMSVFDKRQRDKDEQDGIMEALQSIVEAGEYVPAAATGPRTAYHVLSAANGFPESLRGKGNTRRFWRHIEVLRRMKTVTEGSYRRENRSRVAILEPQHIDAVEDCTDAQNVNSTHSTQAVQGATAPMHSIRTGGIRGALAHANTANPYQQAKAGE